LRRSRAQINIIGGSRGRPGIKKTVVYQIIGCVGACGCVQCMNTTGSVVGDHTVAYCIATVCTGWSENDGSVGIGATSTPQVNVVDGVGLSRVG